MNRRTFLEKNLKYSLALSGIGLASNAKNSFSAGVKNQHSPPDNFLVSEPIDNVRIAVIGLGTRGFFLFQDYLNLQNTAIIAVCDINRDATDKALEYAKKIGKPAPNVYGYDAESYLELLENEEIDLVLVATPWEWHAPMSIEAMRSGAHVAVEVPAATTVEECWQIVLVAEQTKKHCVMLENVNYFQPEMAVLKMVRHGLFGELLHLEGGYLHDIRREMLDPSRFSPDYWRLEHIRKRNASLYPTHGIGPLANYIDINRGNQFTQLYSVASPTGAIEQYIKDHRPDSKYKGETFACGNMVTTTIKTYSGQTILIKYSTTAPMPYSRACYVQGTKGMVKVHPESRLYLDEFGDHKWVNLAYYYKGHVTYEFNHDFWNRWGQISQGRDDTLDGRHGNGDTIMNHRLIECLRSGVPTDMNVYDAASQSAIIGLSEKSISSGNVIDFPDFTRGKWKDWSAENYKPL